MRKFLRASISDRAVLYGVLSTARGFFSGPITAIIIAYSVSSVVQGYYYTFAGLVTLQVFLELGFAQVIVQFAAYEWGFLELRSDRTVGGDANARARVASLMRMAMRRYTRAGAVLRVGLSVA